MKILITIPCLMTGGTEIQTLNLVRALVEGGHEVVTACYFEHTDYMIGQYEKAGSRVVLFSQESRRLGGLTGIWFLAKHLWRLKRAFRPDAVHVQYMAPGAIPIILLWLMGQKNILATTHTPADIYGKLGLKMIHFLQKYVLRVFTCITKLAEKSYFGNNLLLEDNWEIILRNGNLPKHLHCTIYNSLPSYIQIIDKVREPKEIITIGVVSRLESIKGMDMVIPAVEKVYVKHKNIMLLIVGDGSLRESMESSVPPHLSPLTSFVGRQSQATLQSYYDQIDILLMPSRSEGFGLTAIEGMARGCVVVASNTGGLPEVVVDGKVGLLHSPESVEDLADKISLLLEDSVLLENMKRNLSTHVSQFTFERYSQSFNRLYSSL